ncbi:MAG: hypothetical protein ACOC88_02325 [Candidatus Bipolaricaulota bacterium]|nr:hypothetical protein [Candidatus Bipolaricaulota bacterium]
MAETKRVRIKESTWKELGKMKEAGQTYDELIRELIQEANRSKLAKKIRESKEKDEEELISVDEL